MTDKVKILMTDYSNKISELELILEYHINNDPFDKAEIDKCLDEILRYEKRIDKLSFYLKNNANGGTG